MPELPEVQTIVSRLDAVVSGATVDVVKLRRHDIVKSGPVDLDRLLGGLKVTRIRRHGKRIIWQIQAGQEFNVHLGMTGNLLLTRSGTEFEKHTHLVMRFKGMDTEVRFVDPRRFGGVWLSVNGRQAANGRFSAPLGPDALAVGLTEFRGIMSRKRQVKALLLDQQVVAGLGNIYTDEALYMSRIHPLTVASELDRKMVATLHRNIKTVLRQAILAGGSSISDYRDADGSRGGYQSRHRVYGRAGLPCRRCGTVLERVTVASRTSCYCPHCQAGS